MSGGRRTLGGLVRRVAACRRCPRLVAWREEVGREPPRRHAGERYWGRPVPSFGDPDARLLVVGLAPAAHGANRTGRMFTGDRSGDWLYRALHRAGFASRPTSTHRGDGLTLRDAWITAAARCAPPGNRPTKEELDACRPFLVEELDHLRRAQVILALGSIGHGRQSSRWGRPVSRSRIRAPPSGTRASGASRTAARCWGAITRASRTRSPGG